MSFKGGERVRIVRCEDDPRAVGREGVVLDQVPPGPLTGGRWTVSIGALLIRDPLCHTSELQRIG
ncbi:hypothetical protein [Streptomyces lonarensis]|uniref:Uncharacterized protein n=1 Tax=Streptomyces lonarensis TaxID=700599 RepID=A0A7X6HX85_9ACTN|nr:hypothetical protein [Streptomyces lonarensis]NJQ04273.1 hypothetical protein [Streptomyces lonarensis]